MEIARPDNPPALKLRRRGIALVYLCVAMTVVLLFTSLAIDYARVQSAKTQLRGVVDGAARYAATGLSDGTYFTKAAAVASLNKVDGTTVTLLAADVVPGNYSGGTFTAGGTPTNAVQVNAQRSAARGNPIPVLFAPGIRSCNVTASAVSAVSGGTGYGVVALNGANINNSLYVDGYSSASGTYALTKGPTGSIANAGSWNLSNTANIQGNLYYSGTMPTNGTVSGSRLALPSSPTLASKYPVIGVPSGVPNSGNFNGGNLTLTAGNYWYSSFNLNSSDTLTLVGVVNLYVSGNVNLNGTVSDATMPTNFNVYNTVSAGVNITTSGSLYANIYAPSSPCNLNGAMNLYGTVVCGQLSTSGQTIHVDTAKMSGSVVTTVK